jgi:diguanylate cyclase (GGDEF)-like protein
MIDLDDFSFLYVEDDATAQDMVKLILEDEVSKFYQAYDGVEGIEIYKEKKPDIILTDINMPNMNGLEMAKKIKEIDPKQAIIVISAQDNKNSLKEAIKIGIDDFVSKPLDIDELKIAMQEVAKKIKKDKHHQNTHKEHIDNLYNLAYYDTLTKIPNRTLFHIKLDKALENATKNKTQVALLFIDLDNFKPINDTYGHEAGDIVLKHISKKISDVLNENQTFARLGGDEFALIMENIILKEDEKTLKNLTNKILDIVSSDIKVLDTTVQISCSIGISIYPNDSKDKEELISYADKAMYEAKKMGKNNFTFYNF